MRRLSGLVRASGYKVVLTGEGADEALGGYDLFKEAKIRQFWARRPESEWRPLPVSYTHLDVYKRQSMTKLARTSGRRRRVPKTVWKIKRNGRYSVIARPAIRSPSVRCGRSISWLNWGLATIRAFSRSITIVTASPAARAGLTSLRCQAVLLSSNFRRPPPSWAVIRCPWPAEATSGFILTG